MPPSNSSPLDCHARRWFLFSSIIDLAAAEMLRESLLRLGRRHRTLLVNLEDPIIEALADGAPADLPEAFAKVSSLEILNREPKTRETAQTRRSRYGFGVG